ncbi:MAG: sulfatase [Myxococcales bacterium]|nr:sulfatase [Myxococcales bacterium]
MNETSATGHRTYSRRRKPGRPTNLHSAIRAASVAILIGCFSGSNSLAEIGPLNIVFILADDLGWMDVGYQGNDYYETPNIDALAAEGIVFTDAYAASPLCSATRASILTGWAPARQHLTGVTPRSRDGDLYKAFNDHEDWRAPPVYMKTGRSVDIAMQIGQLPLSRVTIAERLREARYVNGFFGKWHLGPDHDKLPQHQGFDVNRGGSPLGWAPKFDPYHLANLRDRQRGEYLTDRLTAEAIEFIDEAVSKQRRFFCYLSLYAVHDPWKSKPEYRKWFASQDDPDGLHANPHYAGMIKSLDDSVGRLVEALNRHGIAEDTIVIFFSDNGAVEEVPLPDGSTLRVTSNDPLRGAKAILREGGTRVPMVVRWTGQSPPGRIERTPVISTDFYPTLLEIAGLEPAPDNPLDGESLVPLIRGSGELEREYLTWFMPHYIHAAGGMDPAAAIRRGSYRLVKLFGSHAELFDLSKDIGEERDLAREFPEIAAELEGLLDAELAAQNAYLPRPNPNYRRPAVVAP